LCYWRGAQQLAAISRISCCYRNGLPCVVWLLTVHVTGCYLHFTTSPEDSGKRKTDITYVWIMTTCSFVFVSQCFRRNIQHLHSRQTTQVSGFFRDVTTWYNGHVSDRRHIGNGPHVGNTETSNHFLPTGCTKLRMRSPNEVSCPT
jgi:hypothetical protein